MCVCWRSAANVTNSLTAGAALSRSGRVIPSSRFEGGSIGSRTVYEIHGSTLRNYCDRCGKKYPESYIYDSSEAVPHCSCGGMIRPDVTLYGESLPVAAWEGAERLIERSDCLIVGGTSLTVYPAASLVRYYRGGYLIIVNRDQTGQEEWADLTFNESIGEVFSHINV